MKTRAGITLIEVLVAIFIMSIGLLALLTLFPLGALSMAQAMKDQRASEASKQALAIANAEGLRDDTTIAPYYRGPSLTVPVLPSNWDGRSFPVFVDPWGTKAINLPKTLGPPPSGFSVIDSQVQPLGPLPPMGSIARTNPSFATNLSTTMLWCGLQDELTFRNDGRPVGTPLPDGTADTSEAFQRDPRTTWAYWLQRPNQAMPNVVELSIVVYSGRNLQLGSAETLYLNAGSATSVVLPPGSDIRRGMWILDVTVHDPQSTDPNERLNAMRYGPVHGYWYRVVAAEETGNGVQLELSPTPTVHMSRVLIMENVVEVFPKGTIWK